MLTQAGPARRRRKPFLFEHTSTLLERAAAAAAPAVGWAAAVGGQFTTRKFFLQVRRSPTQLALLALA